MDNNFNGGDQNSYMQPDQGGVYMQPDQGGAYMQQEPKKGCGFGIAALIVGILSMTLCCVGGAVLGVIGAVLGIVGLCRKESKYGLAIAGIVTSVLGILIGIYMIFVLFVAGVAYDEIKDMDEDELQMWLEERMRALENGDITRADDPQQLSEAGYRLACGDDAVITVSLDPEYAALIRRG